MQRACSAFAGSALGLRRQTSASLQFPLSEKQDHSHPRALQIAGITAVLTVSSSILRQLSTHEVRRTGKFASTTQKKKNIFSEFLKQSSYSSL